MDLKAVLMAQVGPGLRSVCFANRITDDAQRSLRSRRIGSGQTRADIITAKAHAYKYISQFENLDNTQEN